jgi:hypothetical protein
MPAVWAPHIHLLDVILAQRRARVTTERGCQTASDHVLIFEISDDGAGFDASITGTIPLTAQSGIPSDVASG